MPNKSGDIVAKTVSCTALQAIVLRVSRVATVFATALLGASSAMAAYTITGEPGPAPVNTTTPNADYAQLDAIMTQFMLRANVPNAQFALGAGERIVFSRAYTASTSERPLRTGVTTNPASANTYDEPAYVTALPTTRFRVASLSKLVTGLALQQLVLDGKVSMTESAYDILREGPAGGAFAAAPGDSRMLDVQVKHLVNHEAGFDRDRALFSTASCTSFPSPTPCQGHPANQPRDIVENSDPVGRVKPWPYPYNAPTHQEWVKTCKRQLEIDLPRRVLHYAPGSPPPINGSYYQFYTNIAYCWAERVIEIRSGMSYENYVLEKVLRPAGIDRARLALADNRDRLYAGDANFAEINAYYDQPGSVLTNIWCAVYEVSPFAPCVVPRPNSFRPHDYGGAGGWVFSAQEYLRMIQSAKLRLRAPHLLDFPANNSTGSDSLFVGPTISSGTSGANSWTYRYSYGAGITEWRVTATNALLGHYVVHTGSLAGTRSFYVMDDTTPMMWVVTLNTSPDWDFGGCRGTGAVPDATKYWCLLMGQTVTENTATTPVITSPNATNSLFHQLRAIYNNSGKRAAMLAAADLWVDQTPLPCNLDVNGIGNGTRNAVADGLMILRAMQGARGTALANAAIGATSPMTTSSDRAEKNARDLVTTKVVDIDGNGLVQPERDGVILMRAMMGLKGSAVTDGLPVPSGTPTRTAWDGAGGMREYINTRCAAGLM